MFSLPLPEPWRTWFEREPHAAVFPMIHGIPFRTPPPVLLAATEDDAPQLASVHRAAFPLEGEYWGDAAFAKLLNDRTVFAIKAVHLARSGTGELAPRGFVLIREAGGDAEVLTVAVHPSWQGRGYGRLLLEEALRELYARRVVSLYLEVAADNEAALRLYRRIGFDQVGRRDGYYRRSNGSDRVAAITMRLDL